MRTNLSCFAVAMCCGAFLACGSSSTGTTNPPGNSETSDDGGGVSTTPVDAGTAADADAAPPVDHGAPSSTYPAFTPDFGQIVQNGGYVMKNPIIVPITWNSDTSQATFDGFADSLGQTSYWQATTSEYGVAAATSGTKNHVHVSTAAPTTMTDTTPGDPSGDFEAMVIANAGKTWPAATQDTIYAFFMPPGAKLMMDKSGQDACSQGVGGYHDQVTVGSVTTSYAVVPSCTFPGTNNTAEQQSTMSMSHELIEAVTDPQPNSQAIGYEGFDPAHFSFDWFQEFQSEVGDACELFASSFYEEKETTPASFDYWVQRTWSNKSGAAGHNPCVPAEANPYFNVTPLDLGMVPVTLPAQLTGGAAQTIMTKGIHIASGQTGTFTVGFYSDAQTSGPWTLSFSYGSPISQTKATYLTASTDMAMGVNGQKATITVKVNSVGSLKAELLVIKSTLNGESHEMPVVIGSE